jgi:CxxC-x17-CxxC domain-containing protein
MGNFNKRGSFDRGPKSFSDNKFGGKSFGGKKSFGAKRSFNDGPALHQAVCASCGKDCEVPFRPNGKKPIYCSICFDKQGGSAAPRFAEKRFDAPRFETARKPEFHREAPVQDNKSIEQLKSQVADMSSKLDKVMYLLSTLAEKKTEKVVAVEAEEVAEVEESTEKAPFKMKKKVSGAKKKVAKKKS